MKFALNQIPKCFALIIFSAAVVSTTISAHAQSQMSAKDKEIVEKFKVADKNQDGKLTLAEAQAGMPRIAKHFSYIDSQGLGYVTLNQILAVADK
ncbi:EF-hand domain-containing protein [Polynucleobacter arcticus]|uniref:Calcium-binding protein n=1 Tax=Polynucleobacter arcticus TaxID=1743165 RepID=A0A6M9PIA7_9BURK|nr:EF-hand domain-containing protein [Polynucleobacter arcticus]QKM60141.1 calcium-binding protein [Polynucleobacter arcticus]